MLRPFKTGYLLILSLFFSIVCIEVSAQSNDIAQPGPKGIFLTLGKKIPCGKQLTAYMVERRVKDGPWKQIATVKTPATFAEFNSKIEAFKPILPAQPLPAEAKLRAMFNRAVATGQLDSLGKRIQYQLRLALGVMYYDGDCPNGNVYEYRITEVSSNAAVSEPVLSNKVSMPYTAKFDELVLVETSRDEKSVNLRWRSSGSNPAPLFMVFRFDNSKPVAASGLTSHYTLNDTTYYTFRDSIGPKQAEQELHYFMAPYDLLGNPGSASQVAAVTRDNFSKAVFLKTAVNKVIGHLGSRISWHFSDPVTAKSIDLYRSEQADKGYVRIRTFTTADSVYIDENIRPEKVYYYFLQANSRNGMRSKQSSRIFAPAYSPVIPKSPAVTAAAVEGGVKLLIDTKGEPAAGVRVFRNDGASEALVSITGLLPKRDSSVIIYVDSSSELSGRRTYMYAARTESPSFTVSELSAPVTARPILSTAPPAPSFLKAFNENGMVKLFWENLQQSDTGIMSYIISRRNETPSNSPRLPFSVIAGEKTPYSANFLDDSAVTTGNTYTYAVQSLDRQNNRSPQKAVVTISLQENVPVAPSAPTLLNVPEGVKIEWGQVIYKDMQSFMLYRYERGQGPVLMGVLPANVTQHTDVTAKHGHQYSYYLTTVNKAGKESGHSEEAGITR